MSNRYRIIPIFVPHRGCPHDCVFCNQKKITGLTTDVTSDEVDKIVTEYLKTIPEGVNNIEVAFYGGSFTGIELKTQKELLETVFKYKEKGLIHRIRLSTRPDYIDIERLELLKKLGVDIIELGVQSLDETVLERSFRGHTPEDVINAVKLIKEYSFKLGLQMMIGLPGDTREKSLNTGKKIIELKPDFVRIYPTLVVKDTYLERMYLNGTYTPLSLEEAVSICTELLMLFNYNNIMVIRIGLQPSENIALDKDVITGPFHPSIRQLVESNFYKIILDNFIKNRQFKNDIIIFRANNKEIANIVGQKSSNIKYLKSKFGFKKVKVLRENIPSGYFYVEYDNLKLKIDKMYYIEKYLKERKIIN
ncbi:elongator complex protein 3 [Thermohalobacter berrensis]|uniref:Radical SAM protein n=1 Tax=Thermohalobacter berrensis TaxID=99594 RepID=A0A419TA93_9FIRM|nr:radical SAM protein [Thermohalobacter berrensis]RKD34404.1 radical SAM protein [Thermohalobacter berrensis]